MDEIMRTNPVRFQDNQKAALAYDYRNQAWLKDGRYMRCGHTEACDCYGRLHQGEAAAPDAEVY